MRDIDFIYYCCCCVTQSKHLTTDQKYEIIKKLEELKQKLALESEAEK